MLFRRLRRRGRASESSHTRWTSTCPPNMPHRGPGGSKPHAGDDEASVVITGDQSLVDCAVAVDLRRNLTGIGLLYLPYSVAGR